MTIRPYDSGLEDAVHEILRLGHDEQERIAERQRVQGIVTSPAAVSSLQAHIDSLRDAPGSWWVASREGQVAGVLAMSVYHHSNPIDPRFSDYWVIREVDVHPNYRRQGVGAAFLEHAERVARHAEDTADLMFASVLELNISSIRMLERGGFTLLRDWRTPISGAVAFMKQLTS